MANILEYIIKITDNTSKVVFGGLVKGTDLATTGMSKLNSCMWKMNQTADLFDRMGQSLEMINKPGIAFEQSMADLSAITGIAGKDLEMLGVTARKTGVDSGLGAVQAAESYKILASQIDISKMGMSGLQLLQKQSITLAQASGLEMGAAAEALSGTINQCGLQASEAARITNVLAAGAKYGAAEIPDLAQSFKVVGAAANNAGLSVEATAGALEVLSKNNVKGAEAGTGLRNVLLKMQTALGVDFSKTSMSEALDQLKPKLKDTAYMTKIFGMENVVAAQFLVQNSKEVAEMTKRVTGTNVAQEQAAIRTDTWGHKMEKFKAKMNDFGISLNKTAPGLMTNLQLASQFSTVIMSMGPILTGVKWAFGGLSTAINWLTVAENRNRIAKAIGTAAIYTQLVAMYAWDAIVGVLTGKITLVSAATAVWNAILAVNPIVWIVVGVVALIAAIVILVSKVQGWGKQWEHVVGMAKAGWSLFVDGVMIGIDKMQIGWYKFKNMMGLGNKSENNNLISQLNADVARRQKEISGAQEKFKQNAKWDLAWKTEVKEKSAKQQKIVPAGVPGLVPSETVGNTGGNATKAPATETVAAGGARNTSITINLGKMVESIVFEGGLKEHAQDMTRQVEEALVRVLYSAQSAG